MKNRKETFQYERLPFYGRLSLKLGNRVVLKNLKKGNWLDILCGYEAKLQSSQINNKQITQFFCLDHRLDQGLLKNKFIKKEFYIVDTLPYKDNLFDNITIINGLEHLLYPQNILKECHRILKKEGNLQIIVPTWFGKPILEFLAFKLKHKQAFIEMNDHKMYYDEKTLWPMLVEAGFKPQNIKLKRIKFYCSLYAIAKKI